MDLFGEPVDKCRLVVVNDGGEATGLVQGGGRGEPLSDTNDDDDIDSENITRCQEVELELRVEVGESFAIIP